MKTYLSFIFCMMTLGVSAQSFYINKKISDPNRTVGSLTGFCVKLSDDFAFIANPESPYDTTGANPVPRAGNVMIYKKDLAGNWNLFQRIQPTNRSFNGQFGWSMDVEDTTLVVGARQELVGTFFNSGSAYVFKLRNGRWVLDQRLIADDTTANPFFGESVAVSGSTIVVGAERNRTDSAGNNLLTNAGAAYVYEYVAGQWQYQEKLSASVRTSSFFGRAVDISGNRIAVSAPEEWVQNGVPLGYYGAVYIFDKDAQGNWNESIHIADSSFRGGAKFIALEDSILIRPSESFGANPIFGRGAVFYLKLGANSWSTVQTLFQNNATSYDGFGWGISFDGQQLAVSVPGEDENPQGLDTIADAGAVYLYDFDKQIDRFVFKQKVVASDRGFPLSELDQFSRRAVAVNGLNLLVGNYFDKQDSLNQNPILSAGSAYFFDTICQVQYNSLADTICQGEQLLFGGQSLNQAGVYYDTLLTSTGCDSIIDLQLTILPSSNDTIQISACLSYTTLGGVAVNQNGIYADTLQNPFGCDSIVVQDVTINTVDTAVTRTSNYLIANAQNASFQWINCITGQALTGEIKDTLWVPSPRSSTQQYAVVVTQGTCVDTSYCFSFSADISLTSNTRKEIQVFPNPSEGLLNIDWPSKPEKFRIISTSGQIMREGRFEIGLNKLDLNLVPGTYFLLTKSRKASFTIR